MSFASSSAEALTRCAASHASISARLMLRLWSVSISLKSFSISASFCVAHSVNSARSILPSWFTSASLIIRSAR